MLCVPILLVFRMFQFLYRGVKHVLMNSLKTEDPLCNVTMPYAFGQAKK